MSLRVVTVKSSGGDYSTLAAAITGEAADLVTLNRELRIDCYPFTDTTAVLVDGFTTSATHYVTVNAVVDHGGAWNSAAYAIVYAYAGTGPTDTVLRLRQGYTKVLGLQIEAGDTTNGILFQTTSTCVIDRAIVRGSTGISTALRGMSDSDGVFHIVANSIVYNFNHGGGSGAYGINVLAGAVYNCTVAKCEYGITTGPTGAVLVNNLVQNCTTKSYLGSPANGGAGSRNNATDDSDAPGTSPRTLVTASFRSTVSGSEDYHLTSSDTAARGYGTILSSDTTYPFATDIDGTPRGTSWDIGADQYAAPTTWTLNDLAPIPVADTFATAATAFSQRSDFAPLGVLLQAATSAISVLPGVGSLTATGFAPSVVVNTLVAPGVGVLTATGFAPAVVVNTRVLPGAGALTTTGFAPTVVVSNNQSVAPGVGALTLSGFAPTVSATDNKTVLAGVGALTLAGLAPTVTATANQFVAPDVGTLTLAGLSPTVAVSDNQSVAPDVGALTLTGYPPTVAAAGGVTVTPDVGVLTLTGYEPTVVGDPVTTTSRIGGFGPIRPRPVAIRPEPGVLALDGHAPSVTIARVPARPVVVRPEFGTLTVVGYAPSVHVTTVVVDAEPVEPVIAPRVVARSTPPRPVDAPQATIPPEPVPDIAPAVRPVADEPPDEPQPLAAVLAPVVVAPLTGSLALDGHAPTITFTTWAPEGSVYADDTEDDEDLALALSVLDWL